MKNRKISVVLDGVDWMYAVGHASDGTKVYPDVNSLKKYNSCWEGCGIVECELTLKKWIKEHDWDSMSKSSKKYMIKELIENPSIVRLVAAKKRLEHLEELVEIEKDRIDELEIDIKKKK